MIKSLINSVKKHYFKWRVSKRCGGMKGAIFVNARSVIGANVFLGNNVHFNGIDISPGGRVDIGDNFHSGKGVRIIAQIHNYKDGTAIPYDNTYIKKDVVIEDNVWFGDQVIILGGCTIGEGAIIQAGSVVSKSIPKYGIAGGNPAAVFKMRDIPHYQKLKAAGKFH